MVCKLFFGIQKSAVQIQADHFYLLHVYEIPFPVIDQKDRKTVLKEKVLQDGKNLFIRCSEDRYKLSVLRLCHEQEHVLQELYQAVHLPGQSCSGSRQSPGT